MEELQENQENQQPETEQQKKDKISKSYDKVMKTLIAVVGGQENLLPAKSIDGDSTATIVSDLFKEERENLMKTVKNELSDLLKKYVACQKEIAEQEKTLEKLKLQKKKEFVESANKWLGRINREYVMTEEYTKALKIAFENNTENEPN